MEPETRGKVIPFIVAGEVEQSQGSPNRMLGGQITILGHQMDMTAADRFSKKTPVGSLTDHL